MQRTRKERRTTNRKSEVFLLSFSHDVFFFYSLREVFSILPCIQFQCFPVVLCFFLSMEGYIPWMFMEIMWEFSICFFAPYKDNIPYAGEFFLCNFFVPYKVNVPMYAGGFKQVQYKEYICWMQVKIYISDQTSLRICNSVHCKKSWRSSSTPASGDAGPKHTGIEKSFWHPYRKFYYKYRTFPAFFTSVELVRYDYISRVQLFRW
jgi:hypothetical protein